MKISKKLKTTLIFGVPLIIGGFLIYKQFKKPKITPNTNPNPNPAPVPTIGWTRYKVITINDPLNVRQSASTSSSIIESLPIGSTIFAKPSSTSGWHEYSKDGSTRFGYVSSTFITPA